LEGRNEMDGIIPIAEIGNYIVFSILIGHVSLQFVTEKVKPLVAVFFGCSFIVTLYFGLILSINL
jgi:hypothetical protein